MKPLLVSLLVVFVLIASGYFWSQNAALQARTLQLERRDQWIAGTIAQLKNGESSVYLYSCANTDLLLEKIAAMPEVERIVFEQTIDLSPKGLQYLPSFPNLRHLDFRGEKALDDKTIAILSECHALEILGIKLCGVTDAGIPMIGRISNLKELRHSGNFSETALQALLRSSPDIVVRESEWNY